MRRKSMRALAAQKLNSTLDWVGDKMDRLASSKVASRLTNSAYGRALTEAKPFTFADNVGWNTPFKKIGASVAQAALNPLLNVNEYAKEAANQSYGVAPRNNRVLAGKGLTAALDLGSVLPIGQGVRAFQKAKAMTAPSTMQRITPFIKGSAMTGAKYGAGWGGGYGLAESLKNNETNWRTLANTAKGAAGGFIGGGVLGWSVPSITSLGKSALHDISAPLFRTQTKDRWLPPNLRAVGDSLPRPGMSIQAVDDPLLSEARKYKSAEEFVSGAGKLKTRYDWDYLDEMQKSKDSGGGYSFSDYGYLSKLAKKFRGKEPSEPFFRAGSIKKSSLGETLDNIYLTDNEALAQQYGNAGKTNVGEYRVLSKKPLDATGTDTLKKILGDRYNELSNSQTLKEKLIKYAKDNGYDSVRFPDSGPDGEGIAGDSLVVWDKNLIKTKSQLTDLWNKAHNK